MAESTFARQRRQRRARRQAEWALLQGLPALAVALMCLVCQGLSVRARQSGDIVTRYQQSARRALDAQDWTAVEMLGRKLVDLTPHVPIGRYYLGRSAAGEGDRHRARRLMQEIAPIDQPGFVLAQWWLIHDLASRQESLAPAQIEELHSRLVQYLQTNQRDARARLLLGQTELALGRNDAALETMTRAAQEEPEYRLVVANVASRLGRDVLARLQAEQACVWLAQQVRDNPHDVDLRIRWVDALTMVGRIRTAGDALIDGLRLQDAPRLRARLVQLAVTSCDLIASRPIRTHRDLQHQLALIERGLCFAPDHPPLLERLASLIDDPLDQDHRAERMLQARVAAGSVPVAILRTLAGRALQQGDLPTASAHLESVLAQRPNSPNDCNNLAWLLTRSEQPDLPRALQLIERALTARPDCAAFHETRGQILVQMQRFDEAITELEQGLQAPGAYSQTHALLADAYEAVGQTQLATYHRTQE